MVKAPLTRKLYIHLRLITTSFINVSVTLKHKELQYKYEKRNDMTYLLVPLI